MAIPTALVALLFCAIAFAETGREAWLRYAPLHPASSNAARNALAENVIKPNDSEILQAAQTELLRGVRGMLSRTLRIEAIASAESAIVLGPLHEIHRRFPALAFSKFEDDAYWLKTVSSNGKRFLIVTAKNDRGILYGVFGLLRKIALSDSITNLDEQQTPYASVRWANQWDNLDGTIERGYGDRSVFRNKGRAHADLTRVDE